MAERTSISTPVLLHSYYQDDQNADPISSRHHTCHTPPPVSLSRYLQGPRTKDDLGKANNHFWQPVIQLSSRKTESFCLQDSRLAAVQGASPCTFRRLRHLHPRLHSYRCQSQKWISSPMSGSSEEANHHVTVVLFDSHPIISSLNTRRIDHHGTSRSRSP